MRTVRCLRVEAMLVPVPLRSVSSGPRSFGWVERKDSTDVLRRLVERGI